MNETVQRLLDEVFAREDQEWWMDSPHDRFGDSTPRQMVEEGMSSEVEGYLTALAESVVM